MSWLFNNLFKFETKFILKITVQYAKGRFKFCLIEDAIQFNIQFCLGVAMAFTPLEAEISGDRNQVSTFSTTLPSKMFQIF